MTTKHGSSGPTISPSLDMLFAALVAITLFQQATEGEATKVQAPRRYSLRCVAVQNTLVLPDAPLKPQSMTWTLGHPARSHSSRKDPHGPPGQRWVHREFEGKVYVNNPQSSKSIQLDGALATDQARHFALRQALYFWPDVGTWEKTDEHWTCSLGARGSLRAEAFLNGRPSTLIGFDIEGRERIALRAIRWEPQDRRHWPVAAELWSERALLWSESFDSAKTGLRYTNSFFVPFDQTNKGTEAGDLVIAVRRIQARPQWIQIRPLEAHERHWTATGNWAEATSLKVGLAGSGWRLDPVPDLVLDAGGQPTGLRWRASGGPPLDSDAVLLAHGWRQSPPSSGLACAIATYADLHPKAWRATLRHARPAGESSRIALLRRKMDEAGQITPLELILLQDEQ